MVVNIFKTKINAEQKTYQKPITRRQALKIFGTCAAGAAMASPLTALAKPSTNDKLKAAKYDYDQATKRLEEIGEEVTAANKEVADSMAQLDAIKEKISGVEAKIHKKEDELAEQQNVLGKRIATNYKQGTNSILSVILSSTSIEELTSNMYYFSKISAQDEQLIKDVQQVKADLEVEKVELGKQEEEHKKLVAVKKQKVEAARAKQQEVSDLVDNLNADVQKLIKKRDEEFAAAQAAAKKAAEEAAKHPNKGGGGGGGHVNTGGGSGSLSAILGACHSVGSPGRGLCAMWVSRVFSRAGLGYLSGNANDMYYAWCTSSNRAHLKPGMIVATPSHPHTYMGRIYGHVGIYVGGGKIGRAHV